MARSREAEASALTDVPLSTDEIAHIAQDFKSFFRDRGRVDNFVRRSYATSKALSDLKASFETELANKVRQGPAGTPSNLSPEEAARFLSPQQLTRLFDGFMQQRLGMVESMRANAESDMRQVDAVVGTLRGTVAALMQDTTIPENVRQKFAQALDQAVEAAASQAPPANRPNPSSPQG